MRRYIYGYRYGQKQPGAFLTWTITTPNTLDLSDLDRWLTGRLGIDISDLQLKNLPDLQTKISQLAWRMLLVAEYLQKSAQVPVFSTGKLINCRPKKNGWEIQVWVPRVDFFPQRSFEIVFRSAVASVIRVVNADKTEDLDDLIDKINSEVIQPLRASAQSGVSTLPILQAAFDLNIPWRHQGGGVYALGWGKNRKIIMRSASHMDSAIGAKIGQDKYLSASVLRLSGVPVPEHYPVKDIIKAREAMALLRPPIVVKPTDKDRSEGVTTNIESDAELERAFNAAREISSSILVEKQAPGDCYRLFISRGELLYSIIRRPRSIEGDGEHSISDLVDIFNEKNNQKLPWLRYKACPLDDLAIQVISEQGYEPCSIPPKGKKVQLRLIESSEWGGDIEDVSEKVHPENIKVAAKAAEVLSLRNAGIDMISEDISVPWYENGAIINEVNFMPYFGGNDTAKAKMSFYLKNLVSGDGRIPIAVFVGLNQAEKKAKALMQKWLGEGRRGHLTCDKKTVTGSDTVVHLAVDGLFDRVVALLASTEVESLIVVVKTNEILTSGLPFDRIEYLTNTNETLTDKDTGSPCSKDQIKAVNLMLGSVVEG